MDIETFLGASASGIFIALAWLWFWLREDSAHPEPRRLIALAFAGGMAAVAIALVLEINSQPFLLTPVALYTAWALIEELAKYGMAELTVLRRRDDDEPIDPVIYLVTTALGFAGVENAIFLVSPLSGTTIPEIIQSGDFRFVGATLVHVLCSGIIGIALGATFYRSRRVKAAVTALGVILAVALHSAFNIFILDASPERGMLVMLSVWGLVIVLLAIIEWIKRIRPRVTSNNY